MSITFKAWILENSKRKKLHKLRKSVANFTNWEKQ